MGHWGKVQDIIEETKKIQFLTVRLRKTDQVIKAIYYRSGAKRCQKGSIVQVNTSAIDLELGTGGFGLIMSIFNCKEQSDNTVYPGHIIKLRYTPYQTPVLAVEAPESDHHPHFQDSFSLQGKKIFVGELHSMLPVLASLLYHWTPNHKLVYIMDDQAALYIALSDHVRYLHQKMDLVTITYGQAVGGDIEAVNLYTALEAAIKVVEADHIIITQGPGVVGTGTQRGFSGMQLVHWIHTIHSCGGEAIVIPRIQFADNRERHYGLSHHTYEPLAHHTLIPVHVPYPVDDLLTNQFSVLEHLHQVSPIPLTWFQKELEEALLWYGKPIKTMGRDYSQEPYFFYAIGAAYHLYKELDMIR